MIRERRWGGCAGTGALVVTCRRLATWQRPKIALGTEQAFLNIVLARVEDPCYIAPVTCIIINFVLQHVGCSKGYQTQRYPDERN